VTAVPTAEAPPRLDAAGRRGYWTDAWYEFRHDPSALVGMGIVVFLIVVALAAPVLAPYDPNRQLSSGLTKEGNPKPPSREFLLGTDSLGRDELSRLMYGARVSLAVGIGANLIAALIGVVLGGVAALGGRGLQTLLMRGVDVMLSIPVLLAAIALLAVTQPNVAIIVLIVGFNFGAYLSRLVFSQGVSQRQRDYVLAAQAAGVRTPTVLTRHIMPQIMPSVLVFCTLGVATAIQLEAALSYVGIGIQPPRASWGNMIADGQSYLSAPWMLLCPAVAIVLAMVGFSLVGDGLRDALDPTLERRRDLRPMGMS
jgi:peptide/nickel transport system permease protein